MGGGDCKDGCASGVEKACDYNNRACADSDSGDGIPYIGFSVKTCSAICDQNSDCPDVCDGKKTRLGDCLGNCTCGTQSPTCVKGLCGATCENDGECKCVGHKWAPATACPSGTDDPCSCKN